MKSLYCAILALVSGGFFAAACAQTAAPAGPPTAPATAPRPRRSISGDQNMAADPAATAAAPSSIFQNIPNPNEGVDAAFSGSDIQAVLAWLQRNTGKVFLTSQALPSVHINYTTRATPPAPAPNGNTTAGPALVKRAQVVFALESLLYGDGVVMVTLDQDTVAVIPADSPLKRATTTAFIPPADTLAVYAPGSPSRLSVFKNIPTPDELTHLSYTGSNYADAKTAFAWLQDNTGYAIIPAQNLPAVQLSFNTDVGPATVGPTGPTWPGLKRSEVVTDLERLLYINGIALLPTDGKSVLAVPVQPPAAAPIPAPSEAAPAAAPVRSPARPDQGGIPAPAPTPAPTI